MMLNKKEASEIKNVDLILKHGTVITMDANRRIIENGAVVVNQGRIVAVGKTDELEAQYQAVRVIESQHHCILPGLIDTHGHGGHCLFKSVASDTMSHWMNTMTRMYKHFVTDEFWYYEGKLAALERLKSGITTGVSVMGSMPRSDDPIFASNHAKAYAETGVREVVAVGPCNPPWPHSFSRWQNNQQSTRMVSFDEALAGAEAVIETWNHGANDRIRVFIAPFVLITSVNPSSHTPPDMGVKLSAHDRLQFRRIRDIAQKYQTRIHTEAFGGMIHLAAQDEYALLGPDVHIQHLWGISFDEVGILARTGTFASSSPAVDQAIARCPVPELLEAGVTTAISTDGTSPSTPFDLFRAARNMQFLQQVLLKDTYYLPAGKLLEMITIDAARCLGWDDDLGSLEVGKKADIITVNMQQPHLAPEFMHVHRLIQQAVGGDVDNVIVDGRVIMQNRQVSTVNEVEVLAEAQAESVRTIERAGLGKFMGMSKSFWGISRMYLDEPISED